MRDTTPKQQSTPRYHPNPNRIIRTQPNLTQRLHLHLLTQPVGWGRVFGLIAMSPSSGSDFNISTFSRTYLHNPFDLSLRPSPLTPPGRCGDMDRAAWHIYECRLQLADGWDGVDCKVPFQEYKQNHEMDRSPSSDLISYKREENYYSEGIKIISRSSRWC